MSKIAGTTTTTSSSAPATFQQPYIDTMMSEAKRLYGTGGPQFYPDTTVAGFTPAETQGQQMVLSNAQDQANIQRSQINPAISTGLGAIDVANNPYIKAAAEAATRPIMQNLREQILPQIGNTAAAGGNVGSTREGIAQGLAIRGADQSMMDTTAAMYGNAYGQGLQSLQNTLSMYPSLQAASLIPGESTAAVGEQQRTMDQSKINEQIARWQYEQALPYTALTEFANTIKGAYGGTGTSTVSATGGDSATNILGAALQIPGLIDYLKNLI